VANVEFEQTELAGAYLISLAPHADERGFFARSFCEREFAEHGLCTRFVQSNVSYNHHAGTLRGMHWQAPPHGEVKIVRCTAGAVHDVIVDLRPDSATWLRWTAVELSADNRLALYIPQGFAHGFLTLCDETQVYYDMGDFYVPEAARGFRWDDPKVGVSWPAEPVLISQRDAGYPDLDPSLLAQESP
jgi:dTDP-4-dehydrorhamnose 3,5-epimerase